MSQGWTIPPELEAEMTPGVRAFVEMLLARIEQLEAENRELRERVRTLELKLGRVARRGQDDDDAGGAGDVPPQRPAKQPPRKRGGQPGHPKHERPLVPTEQCDEVHVLKPDHCRRCGKELHGDDPQPLRHQVFELPEIKLEVTEYQRHRLTCSCGTSTCAALSDGVPEGQSGPGLTAFVALLMGMFRQSKRRVSLFCETLFGHSMSPGTVVKLQNQATEALRPEYDRLAAALPAENVVHADETGTKQENRNAWIWTFVAKTFTLFAIRPTKAACVIKELLGEAYDGVVISDRAKTYHWVERHQWCWAHLKRDFETMAARQGKAGKIGQRLLDATYRLFHDCHRRRDGTITERGFLRRMTQLRGEVESALQAGSRCADRATAATCNELLDYADNLWLFVYNTDVAPTNNAAERSLRHAVIWRGLSFGTQSAAGSRFVETLLTVLETCRQQGHNAFAFLTSALTRHFQPTASLCGV